MIKNIIIIGVIISSSAYSQVGINTQNPDPSANLTVSPIDLNNNAKGTLLSAMTTIQRAAISSPAQGLIVYDSELKCLMSNNGTPTAPIWECIGGSNATPGLTYFKQFHYALPSSISYNSGSFSAQSGIINNTDQSLLSNWLRTNDPSQLTELPMIDGIRVDIVFKAGDTYRPLIINTNATGKNLFGLTKADISGTFNWNMPSVFAADGGYLNIDNDRLLGWDNPNVNNNIETSISVFRVLGDNGSLYRVTFWGYTDSTNGNKHQIHILLEKFDPQKGGVHN
ncbi:hypothetical protein [Chryseobacterium sp. OV279]|uniref:hypothetical protein n=1 Tax=Chryseobacterium sp. OV279 TaxID=1500285 RepID=UPI00091D4825|nr:hypothetical protein [Chryseobacterium sp. OV279]SHF44717.1 hypothetical protein SAMN02787100_2020 [Chryseobacterium sp. OV279]